MEKGFLARPYRLQGAKVVFGWGINVILETCQVRLSLVIYKQNGQFLVQIVQAFITKVITASRHN